MENKDADNVITPKIAFYYSLFGGQCFAILSNTNFNNNTVIIQQKRQPSQKETCIWCLIWTVSLTYFCGHWFNDIVIQDKPASPHKILLLELTCPWDSSFLKALDRKTAWPWTWRRLKAFNMPLEVGARGFINPRKMAVLASICAVCKVRGYKELSARSVQWPVVKSGLPGVQWLGPWPVYQGLVIFIS